MFYKIAPILAIVTALYTQPIVANNLNGSWHLRVLDGMEVRKARAILDFNIDKMKLSGFDACNRIGGTLVKNSEHNMTTPMLMSTKMACRGKIFNWVSKRLHETLKEGFDIKEEKKYGVKGITIKSPSHELFFKKMGK
ncbi:MAG TPA: META domain-containing protein [Epsilonproteobacteria bacterium]|nr:META domain-containing protein [Campylobacterota bacterium]